MPFKTKKKTKRRTRRDRYGIPEVAESGVKLIALGTALGVASNYASRILSK